TASDKSFRRGLVAAKEIALPARKPIDQIVVDVFRRASNEEAISDFLAVFVLRPTVAAFAKRDFVPLRRLMIVARLGEFLAVPNLLDALVEYVAHVGGAHAIETAQPHAAVVMDRHGLVDDRARYAFRRFDHVRERAVLEHDAGANDVDD